MSDNRVIVIIFMTAVFVAVALGGLKILSDHMVKVEMIRHGIDPRVELK